MRSRPRSATITLTVRVPVSELKMVAESAGYKVPRNFASRINKNMRVQRRLSDMIVNDWQLLNEEQDPGESFDGVFDGVLEKNTGDED